MLPGPSRLAKKDTGYYFSALKSKIMREIEQNFRYEARAWSCTVSQSNESLGKVGQILETLRAHNSVTAKLKGFERDSIGFLVKFSLRKMS